MNRFSRRLSRRAKRLGRQFLKQWRASVSVSLSLFAIGFFLLAPAAAVQGDQNGVFKKRLYIGFGAGISSLDPDSMCPCLSVDDGTDQSFTLFLGYDLASRLSVEAHYSDLGAAGIDFQNARVGELDYSVAGVSAIGYLFGNRRKHEQYRIRALDSKEGLSGYVRVGAGIMENDSNLSYDRDHKVHFQTGLGLEYGWSNGLAVRAEVTAHDSDAVDAGIRLLKRFGQNGKRSLAALSAPALAPLEPEGKPPVERKIEPPLLYFDFGKFNLTTASKASLDLLVAELLAAPERNISIEGHADSIDTEDFNIELSIDRAATVKRYLMEKGLGSRRMVISGFGESLPVGNNATAEGRAKNRRVEIYTR